MASRLDCCARCESEEDTENTKLGRHVDAYTNAKEREIFLPLMSLRRCSERDKELMATRRYKPIPVENFESVLA